MFVFKTFSYFHETISIKCRNNSGSSTNSTGITASSDYPFTANGLRFGVFTSQDSSGYSVEATYDMSIQDHICTVKIQGEHKCQVLTDYTVVSPNYRDGVSFHDARKISPQVFDYQITFEYNPEISKYDQVLAYDRKLLDSNRQPVNARGEMLMLYLQMISHPMKEIDQKASKFMTASFITKCRQLLSTFSAKSSKERGESSHLVDISILKKYYGIGNVLSARSQMEATLPLLMEPMTVQSQEALDSLREPLIKRAAELKQEVNTSVFRFVL